VTTKPTVGLDETLASTGLDATAAPATAGLEATVASTAGLAATMASTAPTRPSFAGTNDALPTVERTHYEVLGEFARGGLGRIVRARDRRTGRQVAIKEMLGHADEAARRFIREARITANLQHPAIVPVYELGQWPDGEPFFAMKLVAGRSLQDVIAKTSKLDERLALLAVVAAVADALAYAHEHRVIHRDLKPANILVGDFGETVVIDWGLAKVLDREDDDDDARAVPDLVTPIAGDATVVGQVLGTPFYMPPEQALGTAADERADVYAIGAMLYHLVAGAPPFADRKPQTVKELVALVTQERPSDLATAAPGVPPDLATIIVKAMATAAEDRYPSARELADDLRRFMTGKLVSAHAYSRRTLLARWVRKHRAAVVVGATLVALIVAGTIVGFVGVTAQRDRAKTSLALALFQKGRTAEREQRWAHAAAFYAQARLEHDTPATQWATGIAEANAIVPHAHHVHPHPIGAVALLGDRVISGDRDGTVHVWARDTGRVLASKRFPAAVWSIAARADGVIAIGDDAGKIHLATIGGSGGNPRDAIDLAVTKTLEAHASRIWALAWSAAGALASASEDATVRIWDATAGTSRALAQGATHAARVYTLAWAGPDRLVSGGDDRAVILWDTTTGVGRELGRNADGGIRAVAVSPAGEIFSTGWDWDGRVWSLATGARVGGFRDRSSVHVMATSPDGRAFVTGGDWNELTIWDASARTVVGTLPAPGRMSSLAMSPDGHWLVSAGHEGDAIVWNLGTAIPRLVEARGHAAYIDALAVVHDGSAFATASQDRTVRLWGFDGVERARGTIPTDGFCAKSIITADATHVIAACTAPEGGALLRWDLHGQELVRAAPVATTRWYRLTHLDAAGTTFVGGHLDGVLAIVDLATGVERTTTQAHGHHIYAIDATPDHRRIATAGLDNLVKIWDGALAPIARFEMESKDGIMAAALSPDGTIAVAASEDGRMTAWSVDAKRILADIPDTRSGTVWWMQFAADGRWLYSAADDGLTRWDTTTWKVDRRYDSGEGVAQRLAITPDGRVLIGVHRSGAIVIWDAATGKVTHRIGGRTRELGSCDDVAAQPFSDAGHRAIVTRACALKPAEHAARVRAFTHLRIDENLDAVLDWSH